MFTIKTFSRDEKQLSCAVFHKIVKVKLLKQVLGNTSTLNQVPVAQWIARWTSNPKVPGSSPGWDVLLNFIEKVKLLCNGAFNN